MPEMERFCCTPILFSAAIQPRRSIDCATPLKRVLRNSRLLPHHIDFRGFRRKSLHRRCWLVSAQGCALATLGSAEPRRLIATLKELRSLGTLRSPSACTFFNLNDRSYRRWLFQSLPKLILSSTAVAYRHSATHSGLRLCNDAWLNPRVAKAQPWAEVSQPLRRKRPTEPPRG